MERKDLLTSLASCTGDKIFINRAQVRRHLGIGSDKAQSLLSGLEFIKVGRERKYFLTDVVNRLLDLRMVEGA